MVAAIILMSGVGTRFQSDVPKQFHRLSGKKIYLHTLNAFLSEDFEQIILVCHKDWVLTVQNEIPKDSRIHVIEGGPTRQESSYKGILYAKTPHVLIHDAVRPFVSSKIIQDNIRSVKSSGATDTAIPTNDTIIYTAPDTNSIEQIPNRARVMRGQTPQAFSKELILEAHRKALQTEKTNSTDDCQLVMSIGHPIHIVAGSEENIKITTELDLFVAEQLLRKRGAFALPKNSLSEKTFLVLGGSGGIGQKIISALQANGAKAYSLSKSSKVYPTDLRSKESIESSFQKVYQEIGAVDGLINAAGFLIKKPFMHLTDDEIEEMLQVNFSGLLWACRFCKIKKGGHIINFSSSSYTRGRKDYGIYSSTKAAVINFTQSLAEEHPELFVNAIAPQRCNTPMRKKNFPKEKSSSLLDPKVVAECTIKILQDSETTGAVFDLTAP